MSSISLTIPNDWQPRPHQRALYDQFGHGRQFTRGCAVWHRRAGKDSVALNLAARDMFKRAGTYWHLFPEQAQARRAVCNGIDGQGRRIIDQVLPPPLRRRTSAQDMLIETLNGSVWQMAGSDNFDSLVGSNPVGVVFSEWALANPEAWDYIRPILVENNGWALFIYTPRGRNHAYATYRQALDSDSWYCGRLTAADTGLIPARRLEQDLAFAVQHHLTRAIHLGTIQVKGAGELQRLQAVVAELGGTGLSLISRVDLATDRLSIRLDHSATTVALAIPENAAPPDVMTFSVPARLRRRGVEARFVIGDAAPERDDILIANIARAEAWRLQIIAGCSLAEIASTENRTTSYIGQMLEFALLAPDLVTEVLAGRQPSGLTTNWLRRHSLPADWAEQRRQLAHL